MSADDIAKIRACLEQIHRVEKKRKERFWPTDPFQKIHLLDLPDPVLVQIISYCDQAQSRPALLTASYKLRQLWKEELAYQAMLKEHEEEDDLQSSTVDMNANQLQLNSLPTDVLLSLCKYLDVRSLGRLSQVCRRFHEICSSHTLWLILAKRALGSNQLDPATRNRSQSKLSAKDRTRLGLAWKKGTFTETIVALQKTKFMPRLELEYDSLWVSWGKTIWCHPRKEAGGIGQTATKMLRGHSDDVSCFKVKHGMVLSGGWDRSICGWSSKSGEFLFARRYCHQDAVTGVDVTGQGQVILTGSRDGQVNIWDLQSNLVPRIIGQVNLGDRIWCLSESEMSGLLAVGTGGHGGVAPLQLLDLAAGGINIAQLGKELKNGAGQLDIIWQTSSTFLACGYDSCARLWDLRSNTWVRSWEESFDESVYCIATDSVNTLLTGTARYGRVRVWDMRSTKPLYMVYATPANKGQSSPVYSLCMDAANIYAALDQSLNHFGLQSRVETTRSIGYVTPVNMYHVRPDLQVVNRQQFLNMPSNHRW